MRNNPLMGPAPLSPSITVHGKACSAAGAGLSLLESNLVCLNGELLAIPQGGADSSWKQWNKQNASNDLRTSGYQIASRVQYERLGKLFCYSISLHALTARVDR